VSKSESYETKGLPWRITSPPSTWEVTPLDTILESLNSGFACGRHQQVDHGLIHLRPMNISAGGKIDLKDCRYIPESAGNRRLEYDDILFNNTNSSVWVGKTAWIGTIAQGLAYSNHMTRLKISGAAISPFIARQLDWLRISGYFELNCNKHVNQASISGDFLRQKTPILLPPLAEQKRIADKLETLLSRVDACRARLDRVPALLKRFRLSVLAAATSGKLTQNDSEDFSTRWKKVPFEELLAAKDKLSYGVLKPGDSDLSGVAMYRVVDVGEWGKRAETTPNFISKKLSNEFKRTIIEEGDILLSVMATIGRSMVATKEMVGANVNRALAVVKPDQKKINSHFLNYYLMSPDLVTEFEERSMGSAQLRINLGDLRKFIINLPPIPEQKEIVRRVENLFAMADRIEARLTTAQKTVERLTPATLAKAFRGELVPQDPNDESAAELLSSQKVMRKGSSKTKSSH